MSDFRAGYLDAYARDPNRSARWAEYEAAGAASAEALAAGGARDDPYWIHTDAYDDAYDIRMQVYARLFDADLGPRRLGPDQRLALGEHRARTRPAPRRGGTLPADLRRRAQGALPA